MFQEVGHVCAVTLWLPLAYPSRLPSLRNAHRLAEEMDESPKREDEGFSQAHPSCHRNSGKRWFLGLSIDSNGQLCPCSSILEGLFYTLLNRLFLRSQVSPVGFILVKLHFPPRLWEVKS